MDAYLNFIEYYLPERRLTNDMINAAHPEWTADKISEKTGIFSRAVAGEDEFASDLAVRASEKLFKHSDIGPSAFDFLLYCTQSPDYFLPTTACILQERLGLPQSCGALDFNLGCSGYIYGLSMAKSLIAGGASDNVLFITAETYSKYIHPKDKGNKTLFGDAAAATVISSQPAGDIRAKIRDFVFYTNGKDYDKLIVRNGGARNRFSKGDDKYTDEGSFMMNEDNLYMDGRAIFEFTNFVVPPLINKALAKNSIEKEEIDLFIFHQANVFMMNTVRKRCQIPEEKFFIFIKDCGNTVSSTIPVAMREAYNQRRIKPGMKILLAGFGVGLSAAVGVVETV